MVTNVGCAILALIIKNPTIFLIGWAGACFTTYGLMYYHETGRLPMGYRSLAMQMRWDITNNDDGYQPGQKLAPIVDIARQHRTTHTTAMRAMRILADEGLVDIVHGRGTYYLGADKIAYIPGEAVAFRIERHLNVIVGRVPAGHPIPSVRSLCAAHKTSPAAVRQVLTDFAHRGLIRSAASGAYVRA